ncbi:FCD domain-containing protein [Devosia sp. 2618]|uniref:FadR/GntR family transcriptional regulator n=1 Tax=Devosia sp. 2618 TaxID=3156454 RepID=UPI003396573B
MGEDKTRGGKAMPSKASARRSITAEVVNKLYETLSGGNFKVGDRLPSEFELAEQFGVGRSAIREAVRELVAFGVLELRRGTGTFVTAVPNGRVGSHEDLYEQLRKMAAQDLLELRLLIEPEVAAIAAKRATAEELLKLRADVEGLAGSDGSPAPEDIGFHLHLVAATHSRSLQRITSWIVEFFDESGVDTSQDDYNDHSAILDAVASRQPELARELMRQHLREVGRKLNLEDTLNQVTETKVVEAALSRRRPTS